MQFAKRGESSAASRLRKVLCFDAGYRNMILCLYPVREKIVISETVYILGHGCSHGYSGQCERVFKAPSQRACRA